MALVCHKTMVTKVAPFTTQLSDQIEYKETGMVRKIVVKDETQQAMVICLKAGLQVPEHADGYSAFMTVLRGRGVFTLDGRDIALEPGALISMPAHIPYALRTEEDLALFKGVDNHDSELSKCG